MRKGSLRKVQRTPEMLDDEGNSIDSEGELSIIMK
jgi:hypothetical protein